MNVYIHSKGPHGETLVSKFSPNSKREIKLTIGGLQYFKAGDIVGFQQPLRLRVSRFVALSNIYKIPGVSKNKELICRAGSLLYVIGCPTGLNDPGRYVVWSEEHGSFVRSFSEITVKDGHPTLGYVGAEIVEFDSPAYKPGDAQGHDDLYMIILPKKGNHYWVSSDLLV